MSVWTKTAKVSVILQGGSGKRYFLKVSQFHEPPFGQVAIAERHGTKQCASGKGARALAGGEFHSASAINTVVTGLVPQAIGWGEYHAEESHVFFFLGDFHDMDLPTAPDPVDFAAQIAEMHGKGTSPNGMFGFHVPTVIGYHGAYGHLGKELGESFTHQLKDVIKYDNETNGPLARVRCCLQAID